MELSWDLFKEYELWLVFIAFMVVGTIINREYDKRLGTLNSDFESLENSSESDRNDYRYKKTELRQNKYFHYIGFWLVCITIILLGILITLLKN